TSLTPDRWWGRRGPRLKGFAVFLEPPLATGRQWDRPAMCASPHPLERRTTKACMPPVLEAAVDLRFLRDPSKQFNRTLSRATAFHRNELTSPLDPRYAMPPTTTLVTPVDAEVNLRPACPSVVL